MNKQTIPDGETILSRALERSLDGEFDRISSIMLDLLLVPRARQTAREMIHALFDERRKENSEHRREVPYPSSTLALVAELSFPVEQCQILWESIPQPRRLAFASQVMGNALLNNSEEWIRQSMLEIDKLGQSFPHQFPTRKISRACLGVINKVHSFYGQDEQSIREYSQGWRPCLTWLVERILRSQSDETYQPHNIGAIEWACDIISDPDVDIEIDPRVYTRLLSVDKGQYPNLMRLLVKARQKALGKISEKKAASGQGTPLPTSRI